VRCHSLKEEEGDIGTQGCEVWQIWFDQQECSPVVFLDNRSARGEAVEGFETYICVWSVYAITKLKRVLRDTR
jgi:hypothetical protein